MRRVAPCSAPWDVAGGVDEEAAALGAVVGAEAGVEARVCVEAVCDAFAGR